MRFRTEYVPRPSDLRLDPDRPLLMAGSCFAANMGQRLVERQWPGLVINPFGTLYNPCSIADALTRRRPPAPEPAPYNGLYYSFDCSTLLSRSDRREACAEMARAYSLLRDDNGDLLPFQAAVITFGTAYVFELGTTGRVVANCHKLPACRFTRRRLSVNEITERWSDVVTELQTRSPYLHFIFTVSPVRHLADGFEGNSRSKATLLLACEQLAALPGCHYFPAYEILNDDLRDYRFYADDMTHPSDVAADYIFGQFAATYFTPDTLSLLASRHRAYRATLHRPLR